MYLSDFRGGTDIETFASAMHFLKEQSGCTLVIEPGTYTLSSELARKAQASVMSGAFGSNPQEVMLSRSYQYTKGIAVDGQHGTTINAYGATLSVDGFMEPVSITNCEDVEIRGLTIDHRRKPYSRGRVTKLSGGGTVCEITLDEDCPIEEGSPLGLRTVFFDEKNRCRVESRFEGAEFVDSHHMRVHVSHGEGLREGLLFYTVHTYHSRPAVLIENCKNITLTDITIHSQPGMGVVGNRSENIFLKRLFVVPSAGHHLSTNTDATHFTSVKGVIRFENCMFDGQGDDSANVHGYYQTIIKKEAPEKCVIEVKSPHGTHTQSLDYPDVGDKMELTDIHTLKVVDTYTVSECFPHPEENRTHITLDHDLPDNTDGLVLIDITRLPRLEITGCTASRHFARGILIKTREAVIENNCFDGIVMSGIEAAAEASWYEGACPANVVIRRNRILNCGNGIVVKADCENAIGQSIANITIEDNVIDCPDAEFGIYVRNVNGLRCARNQIRVKGVPLVIENSTGVQCDTDYQDRLS